MLDKITWAAYCPQDRKGDLIAIFKLGMKYVDAFNNAVIQPWNVEGLPTHMRPWLAELDLTLKHGCQRTGCLGSCEHRMTNSSEHMPQEPRATPTPGMPRLT